MPLKTTRGHRESQRKYRAAHLEEQRNGTRRWWQMIGRQREILARIEIKREVLAHYGKNQLACVICGESRLACLSIDHIDGGGKSHRKELNAYGHRFYKRLKQANFPKGYQTLCMNCQFVKVILDKAKAREIPE